MIIMKEKFIQSIHDKKKIELKFFSKEDSCPLTRVCAPLDYGSIKKAKDKTPRFHFWDYESDKSPHPLLLKINQIISMNFLDEGFDPGEFVTWNTKEFPWHISRDWGKFS